MLKFESNLPEVIDPELQAAIDAEAAARANADAQLQAAIDALRIPGTVQYFAMQTAPQGWLVANGSLVSRTDYAALFAAVGTTYGEGDGATTFALPDLRGEFVRGFDDGRGVDNDRVFGTTQEDIYKAHNHGIPISVYGHYEDYTHGDVRLTADHWTGLVYGKDGVKTDSSGGTETRPRNLALLACIKY